MKPNFSNCPTSASDMKNILFNLEGLSVVASEPKENFEQPSYYPVGFKIEKSNNIILASGGKPDLTCSHPMYEGYDFCIKEKRSFRCEGMDLTKIRSENDFNNIIYETCPRQLLSSARSGKWDNWVIISLETNVQRQPDGSPCAQSIDQQNIKLVPM